MHAPILFSTPLSSFFGAPRAAVEAVQAGMLAFVGMPSDATHSSRIGARFGPRALRHETSRLASAWLAASPRRQAITLGDPAYPAALLSTEDPPLLLFAEGRVELLAAPALSVVGSRHPTPQGAANAREFAAHLSAEGWTIVSGLAQGVDGAAHEGALTGTGSTIAVVGTGPDIPYPRQHAVLTQRIAESGLLLSEYAPGTPPLPANFPLRNRIIAGLGRGTLVVEAALQSGSLITARLAVEAGREVFAIPGSIHSPQSRGCHALIRQGAKLVESARDIVEELGGCLVIPTRAGRGGSEPAAALTPGDQAPVQRSDADAVLGALGHDPATLDALSARTGMSAAALGARLLELELEGVVSRLPGGLFQRLHIA